MTLAPPKLRTVLHATLLAIAASLAAAPRAAHADEAPTAEQLAEAKKAYAEGKAAFDKGSYGSAVDKFKESYRLSKNPLLLFNIAITFERLGARDMALFYYKKFLADAPADAAQRPEAEKNVAALESSGTVASKGDGSVEAPATAAPVAEAPKPAASCVETDVQHQIVEDAPPGKPLDLTAFVPTECNWSVVLFFRGAGDDKFVSATMKPRYNELVGRIPAAKMSGNAVQYYVEVKATDGALIKRIGKSTSPNVVYIDEAATARFYPDLSDSGELVAGAGDGANALANGDEEDPLAPKTKVAQRVVDDEEPSRGGGGGETFSTGAGASGFTDVGSSGFNKAKWITTGVGGTMLLASVAFYGMASSWGTSIEGEANASTSGDCPDNGGPPCRTFDENRQKLEATGKRYETFSKITFAVGVLTSGVAGYLWYKERSSKKRSDRAASTATGLRSLVAAPVAGDGFFGGAAALRF